MSSSYRINRSIAIDAGHRIASHGSKCRHLHGHRYLIEAWCRATQLHEDGEQQGMVLDFGFLKDEMFAVIHADCDHSFIAHIADEELLRMFCPEETDIATWIRGVRDDVEQNGWLLCPDTRLNTRLYVMPESPTAEGLARHWFGRLEERVHTRSDGIAALERVRVWETPNCWAEHSID